MNKTPPTYTDQLRNLASRLKENRDFFAWALSIYQQKEHIDNERLIAELKTTPEMFVRLALCKCPNRNSSTFVSQIREISTYTNTDPIDLAYIIRYVDALETLSKIPAKNKESIEMIGRFTSGLLAAARDRSDVDENDTTESNKGSDSNTRGNNVVG